MTVPTLTQFAFPLGGIGSGNLSFCGTGQLVAWQIMNNINSGENGTSGAIPPATFFAVWTKQNQSTESKILQTVPIANLPLLNNVEVTNRFPILNVNYDTGLPVQINLETWSPFIMLNAKDSALPVAMFTFTLTNPTDLPLETAVLLSLQNLIGWEGYHEWDGFVHEDLTNNYNTVENKSNWQTVLCQTQPGLVDKYNPGIKLFTPDEEIAWLMRLTKNCNLEYLNWTYVADVPEVKDTQPTVLWVNNVPLHFSEQDFVQVLNFAEQGGSVILSGIDRHPLLVLSEWLQSGKGKIITDTLPFTWTDITVQNNRSINTTFTVDRRNLYINDWLKVSGWSSISDYETLAISPDNTPLMVRFKYGSGSLTVIWGFPGRWTEVGFHREFTGKIIASACGIEYFPRTGWETLSPGFGSMTAAVNNPSGKTTILREWTDLPSMWTEFAQTGEFNTPEPSTAVPTRSGQTVSTALSAKLNLSPQETKKISFVVTWHFPNRYRNERFIVGGVPKFNYSHHLGNAYSLWFKDAKQVLEYYIQHQTRLYQNTLSLTTALWDNTLPSPIKDAVAANLAILRSSIYMWLADGNFYGFEGADGCCPMNCTHVFNYAQSLAYCFPELERTQRNVEWKIQQHPEKGYIPHRVLLPLTLPRLWDTIIGGPDDPALDGMLGAILKTYREFKLYGNIEWLSDLVPYIVKLIVHIWDKFDPDGDGVITGEQPNTYDIHSYGSNTFIGTLYLAALKVIEKIVTTVLSQPTALESHNSFSVGAGFIPSDGSIGNVESLKAIIDECKRRFVQGQQGYLQRCWNGEYFINAYDAVNVPSEKYNQINCWGTGCHSDQFLGQWWAEVLGIEDLFPPEIVRKTVKSIFRYNWQDDFQNFVYTQRVFVDRTESGVLNCTWPKGERPEKPINYADEVWTGIEYTVAAMLIDSGMWDEAVKVVTAVRNRYTGLTRNPFAELECGHYYTRALSSWSLYTAALGFSCDVYTGSLSFMPNIDQVTENVQKHFPSRDKEMVTDLSVPTELKISGSDLSIPFSAGTAWGMYRCYIQNLPYPQLVENSRGEVDVKEIEIIDGTFELQILTVPLNQSEGTKFCVRHNGTEIQTEPEIIANRVTLHFPTPVKLTSGSVLSILNQH